MLVKQLLTIGKLKALLAKMEANKMVLEWAIHHCDKEEEQNIVWMDCHYGFSIDELKEIIKYLER